MDTGCLVTNFRCALRAQMVQFPKGFEGKIEKFRCALRAQVNQFPKEFEGRIEKFRCALRAQILAKNNCGGSA